MSDESVFPSFRPSFDPDADAPHYRPEEGGLTLRQLYAGMAMQAILGWTDRRDLPSATLDWPGYVAVEAVSYADALIEALEAPK